MGFVGVFISLTFFPDALNFYSQLFDKVKSEQPNYKQKCRAISGDIVQEGLGIDQSDEDILVRDVSVVFHSAATIKFDEDMK